MHQNYTLMHALHIKGYKYYKKEKKSIAAFFFLRCKHLNANFKKQM